jgi:N-acetyl-anhydromuramyl-L-alanine amidase AmpD
MELESEHAVLSQERNSNNSQGVGRLRISSAPCLKQKQIMQKVKNRMKTNTKIQNLITRIPLVVGAVAGVSSAQASTDYGPAIWRPACSGHWYTGYNARQVYVIHDMEGYYASTISYLQGCNNTVSVHYCVNGLKDASSDMPAGEITQMVRDADSAWTAGCWNRWAEQTEHEGFASNPAWYTAVMYDTSAALTRSKADKYGIPKDRNHIIAHGQKLVAGWASWASANLSFDPYCNSHTDPGPYWDWAGYMARIGGAGCKPAEFDPNTAAWYLRNSNTTGGVDNSFYFGAAGDIPVMGDWDGNGSITPGVFRPSTAVWYLRNSNSNGGVDAFFSFGVGSDIPVVGDWDGNGTYTIGVFRPSTAQWFLRNSNSNGGVDGTFYFGVPGDRPIVGDWDGNRTFTPGVFRNSEARFYLRNSNSNGGVDGTFEFGVPGDFPITGDWNGDGYWTVGVFRSNGIRYLTNSNLNPTTDVFFTYGAASNRHLVWR